MCTKNYTKKNHHTLVGVCLDISPCLLMKQMEKNRALSTFFKIALASSMYTTCNDGWTFLKGIEVVIGLEAICCCQSVKYHLICLSMKYHLCYYCSQHSYHLSNLLKTMSILKIDKKQISHLQIP